MSESHGGVIDTPVGPLTVVLRGNAVTAALFGTPEELSERFPATAAAGTGGAIADVRAAVAAYFAGELTALDTIAVDQPGTAFQRRVWQELRAIPAGKPISYGELAARLDSSGATRAVGSACGRNHVALIVPCHRVVRSDGGLGGYAYGTETKRTLLAHEGWRAAR